MRGRLRRVIYDKGYGFISSEDGRDIFFHRSDLQGTYFSLLEEGNNVEFNVESGSKGFRAVNIRIMENLSHQSLQNEMTEGYARKDSIERQLADICEQLKEILERLDKIDEHLEQIQKDREAESKTSSE